MIGGEKRCQEETEQAPPARVQAPVAVEAKAAAKAEDNAEAKAAAKAEAADNAEAKAEAKAEDNAEAKAKEAVKAEWVEVLPAQPAALSARDVGRQ